MIVLNNWESDIGLVPTLLPGLKRLWFDIETKEKYYGTDLTLADKHAESVKAYSQIKFSSLVGANVTFARVNKDDQGLEERLERALLGK